MKKSYSAPEESYLVNFDEKKNPSSTNLSRTTKTSKNTNFKSFSLTLNLAKRSYQQYYVKFSNKIKFMSFTNIRLLGVKRLRFFNRPHQTQNSHCGKNVNSINQMTGKLEIFFSSLCLLVDTNMTTMHLFLKRFSAL